MNWIFLRGLMREADHWGEFRTLMKQSKEIAEVVCLDLPGVGTEAGRFFIPNIKQIVADLRSRFQHMDVSKKEEWCILGISLGGMIAMEWASLYPDDFKKIVVINASASNLALWKRLKPESMLSTAQIFMQNDLEKRERKIIEMTSNLKKTDSQLIKSWIGIAKKTPFSKVVAINQLLAASYFELPDKLKIPMLVLTSRADKMVDWQCSSEIAKHFKAEIKIHPTAGHDICVDDPYWVKEQIHSFA